MFDFISDNINKYWDDEKCLLTEKRLRVRDLVNYMLDRSQQIFVWQGLPETIPERNLELLLQTCGNICITDVTEIPEGRGKKGLYAFFGGLGNLPNAYYEPTEFIVCNPYLEFNKSLKIGSECVWCRNDALGTGLIPMFLKYASMMNENEISLNICAINYRIDNLISADDDRTFESAKKYLNDIISGKLGVISSSEFFEGLKTENTRGTGKNIKDLIEYEQYLKASWYNEIGLNSNYNMKRERIVSAEAELTDDALIPLVENMLYCRQHFIKEIKDLYGDKYDLENLDVKLNSIWDLDNMYVSIPHSDITDEANAGGENDFIGGDNMSNNNGISDNMDNDDEILTKENDPEEINEDDKTVETTEDETEDAEQIEINVNIDSAESVEVSERSENDETEKTEKTEETEETEEDNENEN